MKRREKKLSTLREKPGGKTRFRRAMLCVGIIYYGKNERDGFFKINSNSPVGEEPSHFRARIYGASVRRSFNPKTIHNRISIVRTVRLFGLSD